MRFNLNVWVMVIFSLLAVGFSGPMMAQSSDPRTEIVKKWLLSGHADATSEAFTHWNDEGEIPEGCATCHSGEGFRAFYGLDGSTTGIIEHPIKTGGVVDCETCHNDGVKTIQSVVFPSGIVVADIGSSATCMTCHQGRQSSIGISKAVTDMAEDEINPELTFINVHYKAAAATLLGTEVKGGYEYEGKTYMGRFSHAPEFTQCTDCHSPHTLEVQVSECVTCHKTEDPLTIRTSRVDFDGDGDLSTGISVEINSLHSALGTAIAAYADQVADAPIVYDDHQYPYFFNDSNGNGAVDDGEAIYPNRYQSWTPRLLKAAYNFQFVAKDIGAYAHNPHYALQILFDSMENLSQMAEMDMAEMTRP